jgi:hypothetical protein
MLLVKSYKAIEGTVIGLLNLVGETAGRQFVHAQVIFDAFAALALSRTRFITAIAKFKIILDIALHGQLYPEIIMCQLSIRWSLNIKAGL